MLFRPHVQRHAADVALVHRPDDFRDYGETYLAGERQDLVLFVGCLLLDQRDVRRLQEKTDFLRTEVTALGKPIDDAAHLGDVHAVKLDIGAGGLRGIQNTS